MRDLVGERVRCLSTGRVYRTIAQSGNDLIGRDEATGEHMGLSAGRVVRHSPVLITLGIVIQTVLFADAGPLANISYLIRAGLLGSILATFAAWWMDLSLLLIFLAYPFGSLIGVTISAVLRYRREVGVITKTRTRTRRFAEGSNSPSHLSSTASWHNADES